MVIEREKRKTIERSERGRALESGKVDKSPQVDCEKQT